MPKEIFLLILVAITLATMGAASAQTGNAQTFTLPGEEVYPEGVAYDPATGDFFVGSTTDGTVFRGNVGEPGTRAETILEPGADGRSTAIGMKVDSGGRLFVAGGGTGGMFVYDTETGELMDRFENGADTTFVNDVALTPDGSAFFTDSMNPELYRVFPDGSGGYSQETYLDFEGTPIEYEEGFNLNGIAATPDGRYLFTVKSLSGQLFRIDTRSKEILEIDTGGADLTNGDGLLLLGRTLYVVRNQNEVMVPVELSQFDARDEGRPPELPFTVSDIPIPESAAPASASAGSPMSIGYPGSSPPTTGKASPPASPSADAPSTPGCARTTAARWSASGRVRLSRFVGRERSAGMASRQRR